MNWYERLDEWTETTVAGAVVEFIIGAVIMGAVVFGFILAFWK
jgi:hypothetical protein